MSLIASLLICGAALPVFPAVRHLGSTLSELRAAAGDADPAVRLEAVVGLAGLNDRAAVDVLARLLASDPNPDVRQMAALRLRLREGDAALAALSRAAESDPSPAVRAEAVRTLATFKTDKAKAEVRKAQADKNVDVRRAAQAK